MAVQGRWRPYSGLWKGDGKGERKGLFSQPEAGKAGLSIQSLETRSLQMRGV